MTVLARLKHAHLQTLCSSLSSARFRISHRRQSTASLHPALHAHTFRPKGFPAARRSHRRTDHAAMGGAAKRTRTGQAARRSISAGPAPAVAGGAEGAAFTRGTSFIVPGGLTLTDYNFSAPLDHSAPDGQQIRLFVREVISTSKIRPPRPSTPCLLFLQGERRARTCACACCVCRARQFFLCPAEHRHITFGVVLQRRRSGI